jgi:hypothetical protein
MKNDAGSQFEQLQEMQWNDSCVGPIKMVAKPLLTLAGGLIDRSAEKKRSLQMLLVEI